MNKSLVFPVTIFLAPLINSNAHALYIIENDMPGNKRVKTQMINDGFCKITNAVK